MPFLQRIRDGIFSAAGVLWMFGMPPWVIYYWSITYGKQWEFGRYGVARALLDSTGLKYADGTSIFPITLRIIQSGNEEVINLALFVFNCWAYCYLWRGILREAKEIDQDRIRQTAEALELSLNTRPSPGILANRSIAEKWF